MAASYEELKGLVEEVRDLLSLIEADKEPEQGKFKKGTAHNPFRWVKKGKSIGPGPKGRTNKKRAYWNCRCAGYKCLCKGSDGEKKRVRIDKGYKKSYNILYRKWRKKHASKFAPGKTFVARPKTKAA